MLDLKYELKVAKEFWDFLGGEGSYELLLNAFEQAGIETTRRNRWILC
nr:TdeIII family type II restriction endonuclease [Helicobacter suis]